MLASHKVTNLIFDVSILVDQKIPCKSIVEIIRDTLIEVDYHCETVTILWPPTVPQDRMKEMLSHMWGTKSHTQ